MGTNDGELSKIKNRIARDTFIYLMGKGIEGIVGILTISIYTRFFLPEIYSDYNLITTGINMATVILMGWLTQSGVRYINLYKRTGEKILFFSTAFRIWFAVNLFVYFICGIGILLIISNYGAAAGNLPYYMGAAVLMFTGFSTSQVLAGFLTAMRAIKLNLFLSVFSVTAKVILAVIGVKLTSFGSSTPAAVILSSILVDFIVIIIIFSRMKLYKTIKLKAFSHITFKKLFSYGIPIAGMGIAMSLLNLSDRYVIIFSLGSKIGSVKNGIYAANYSMASAVFTVLMIGLMRGVYPNILKAWKQNDRGTSMLLLTQGIRNYTLIAMPCVVGLCILSGMVSGLFLHTEYHSGSNVIIWVSIGMFFLGLTEYSNKPWELTSKTIPTLVNSFICGIFNITVNLLFIPVYGYMTAAVTTALSYLLYFVISIVGGKRVIHFDLPVKSIARIAAGCFAMGIVVVLLLQLLAMYQANRIIILISSVVCGAGTYGLILYLTGEVKNETRQLWKKLAPHKTQG